MAYHTDLRNVYAKQMEGHGAGFAMFQPVSSKDITPPCCGFFDRNGDWNLITNISADTSSHDHLGFTPLAHAPTKVSDINIVWQPKVSAGVQAVTVDASGSSPDNLPGGAEAHVKYKSNNKFGAVLISNKPVTLTAYNHERLFLNWLDENKKKLLELYGPDLRRYGMWIVTRTYTSPGCSINAWLDSNKEVVTSLKAKASMMGELGEDLELSDKIQERDWCHYQGKDGDGVVLFLDGIDMTPLQWKLEAFRQNLPTLARADSRSRRQSTFSTRVAPMAQGDNATLPMARRKLILEHSGELHQNHNEEPQLEYNETARLAYNEKPRLESNEQRLSATTDERYSRYSQMLLDVGVTHSLSRSASPSVRSSVRSSDYRTPSLRREKRSISAEHEVH